MKKLSNQTIILSFIIGLILLTLFYFLLLREQNGNKPLGQDKNQIELLTPPGGFQGPNSPPYTKGPSGPPPGY